jgi:protein associated with RNAse G/E
VTDDAPQHLAAPAPERPTPGTALQFRWRKWDGGAHWVNDCVYLGSDRWGDWLGQPLGWRNARPGRVFPAETPAVMLVPPSGDYVLTVNAAPHRVRIYIDIAWDVRWEDREPRGIDMDLDVVRATDGRGLFIDDRDEWDEHRVAYGYPLDLVTRLEQLAVDLERRVGAAEAPFDDATADSWLARLAGLEPVAPPASVRFSDRDTAVDDGAGGPGTAA